MHERIMLGRTGLQVSPICFGCWQMGGKFWGEVDVPALTEAVTRAVELGVNFFDTADAYGNGLAEELLGKMLADIPRESVIVATKAYHHWYGQDNKRMGDLSHDYLLWECEQSLKRMNMEYVDLYQAHSFDVMTHPEETARAMEKLKADGKIRAYGVSNFTVEQLRLANRYGSFDSLQPRYSLMQRDIEHDLLPYCLGENIGVLVYSPLHYGMLTGKFTGDETFSDLRENRVDFMGQKFKDNAAMVRSLAPLADRLGKTITQLSLRALLDHPAVHCTIVGIKKAAHIEEAVGAMGWQLTREDFYQIRNTVR